MLAVAARLFTRAALGSDLAALPDGSFVYLTANVVVAPAVHFHGCEIIGNGHSILASFQFAGQILSTSLSDLEVRVDGYRFADSIENCSFSNVTILYSGAWPQFELAATVSCSFFDVLMVVAASQPGAVLHVDEMSNSGMQMLVMDEFAGFMVARAVNLTIMQSYLDGMLFNLAGTNITIRDSNLNQSSGYGTSVELVNVFTGYNSVYDFLRKAASFRMIGDRLVIENQCHGDCRMRELYKIIVWRRRCNLLSLNVCYENPCNVEQNICFGHGKCVDFRCECEDDYLVENMCAALYYAVAQTEFSYFNLVLMLSSLVFLVVGIVVYALQLKKSRNAAGCQDVARQAL